MILPVVLIYWGGYRPIDNVFLFTALWICTLIMYEAKIDLQRNNMVLNTCYVEQVIFYGV